MRCEKKHPTLNLAKKSRKQSKLSSILSLQAQVYYCLSLVSFEFYTSYIVSHTSQKCLKKLKYPNTSLKLITTLTPTTTTSSQAYSRHDGSSFTCDGNDLILHCIKYYTFLTMLHHYLPPPSFTCRVSGVGKDICCGTTTPKLLQNNHFGNEFLTYGKVILKQF